MFVRERNGKKRERDRIKREREEAEEGRRTRKENLFLVVLKERALFCIFPLVCGTCEASLTKRTHFSYADANKLSKNAIEKRKSGNVRIKKREREKRLKRAKKIKSQSASRKKKINRRCFLLSN